MRYAVNVPNFAEYADVRAAAALAAEAEAAGWDGFFVWDHIVFAKEQRLPVADPWILLAAVALATERLRLGPMVTPLARRRPWKVARETVTLDHLSGGRLILGVGLGTPAADEYGELLAIVRAHRPGGEPFEVMVGGETAGGDPTAALAVVEPLAEAGMTWWTESLEPRRGGLEEMRERVRQGPPGR